MAKPYTHHNKPVRLNGYGSSQGKVRRNMPVGIDTDYFSIYDDFLGIALDATNDWTVVKDSGASVGITADTVGGEANLTSAATTDNDGASIQANETFSIDANKSVWFETRIKCNDADQTDLCFGLTVNFATNPEAMLTAADRVVFQVNDGNASILCKTEKNGTETSTDSGSDLADDTYVKLGINIDGTTSVKFYIDDLLVATHTSNLPDDENLTPAAMSLSGSASGTRATTIDYILAVQER